jgi:hypothetical protein
MVRPIIITVAPKMNDAGLLSVIEHTLDLEEMSGSKWKLSCGESDLLLEFRRHQLDEFFVSKPRVT